jgi:hexokinase
MAPVNRPTPQRVLEDVAAEFTLDDGQLHEITQQFLDDFQKGLSEYGQPMAMM